MALISGSLKIVYRQDKVNSAKRWFQKNRLLNDHTTVTLTFQGSALTITPIRMHPESSEMKLENSDEWSEESFQIMDPNTNTVKRQIFPKKSTTLFEEIPEE
jgi:hypothetical protein